MKQIFKLLTCFFIYSLLGFVITKPIYAQRPTPLIADHRAVQEFEQIPEYWIEQAKNNFVIGYGHTSHGSQITTGMSLVRAEYGDLYNYDRNGADDALYYFEGSSYASGWLELDVGYYPSWVNETNEFLQESSHAHFNIIMWSWCGQASSKTETTMMSEYLQPMADFEQQYPDITFIYMTGHLDGSGVNGNLRQRNDQIRDYVIQNNKVLFDFADIERHDPNGIDYPDESDACNWCYSWCSDNLCPSCSCAHSHCFNCYRKGKAFWWMMARLAGWNPDISPLPSAIPSPASSPSASPVSLWGDVNNDGSVDSQDAQLVLFNWKQGQDTNTDINTDSSINAIDFSYIIRDWGL